MEDNIQPQTEEQTPKAEAGAETPQPPVEEVKPKSGAEQKPQPKSKKERTYTAEEWSKREAEKDKEITKYKTIAAQSSLESQIREVEKQEAESRASDKAKVEQGSMTEEQFKQNENLRKKEKDLTIESLRLISDKESIAKVKVAEEVAKEFGVDSQILLTDDIKNPADMIRKASSLARQKDADTIEQLQEENRLLKEKEQKFDAGQKAPVSSGSKSLKERYKNSPELKY